ncbi:MAG: outer membrane beta-barrel protein [Bacteroidota bacterium]
MKTFLLSFFLLCLSIPGYTQTTKGNFLVGGKINFESVKDKNYYSPDYASTNFIFSPNIGYFIVDNIAGGFRLDLGAYNSGNRLVETRYRTTSISPFLRCYFLPVQRKVNAFLDAGYLYQKTRWRNLQSPEYVEKSHGFSIMAGPAIFLSKQIAVEFTVGFKHTKLNAFEATRSNTFNSGVGLQIHLGKTK